MNTYSNLSAAYSLFLRIRFTLERLKLLELILFSYTFR